MVNTWLPMSRENVELVRSLQPTGVDLVEVFATEDSMVAGLDPDAFADDLRVEFISGESAGAQQTEYRGGEGLLEAWKDWLSPWTSYRIDVEDILDGGDEVVAFVRIEGRTVHDDVVVQHAPAAVYTVRDLTVTRLRFYLDRDDALAAAGLGE